MNCILNGPNLDGNLLLTSFSYFFTSYFFFLLLYFLLLFMLTKGYKRKYFSMRHLKVQWQKIFWIKTNHKNYIKMFFFFKCKKKYYVKFSTKITFISKAGSCGLVVNAEDSWLRVGGLKPSTVETIFHAPFIWIKNMEAKIEWKITWHCCICSNPAKGRVDFENSWLIKSEGWNESLSANQDQSKKKNT